MGVKTKLYFSGKVTNSFFVFLSQCEFDTSRFFEMTPLEMNFLKDPHSWMEASQVERFLNNIKRSYGCHFEDKDLITTVGHNCADLRSWGGLEDFLKMFRSPEDIHRKLKVFFSYFISPVFEISRQKEGQHSVCFQIDFDLGEYPLTASYFKAVLETLPVFLGGELTEVRWTEDRLEIFYPSEENLFFPLAPAHPEKENPLLKKLVLCETKLLALKKKAPSVLLSEALRALLDVKERLKKEEL